MMKQRNVFNLSKYYELIYNKGSRERKVKKNPKEKKTIIICRT